jgi:superfamily II DNA or RNA helicase
MFEIDDRLRALRRPEIAAERVSSGAGFFFRIGRVDGEACLTTVNDKGLHVTVEYRAYSGAEREMLKALARDKEIGRTGFGWGEDGEIEEAFLIQGKPELLHLLLNCRNVVNAALEPVAPAPGGTGRIGLRLDADAEAGLISASLEWRAESGARVSLDSPQMLGPELLLDVKRLHRFDPVGPAYSSLPLFVERVSPAQLESFLTLFVSAFPEIGIEFPGYRIEPGEAIEARPSLVFREVDGEGILHFSLSESVARLPVDFVRDYDIPRVALVDAEQRTVRIREVVYDKAYLARSELVRQLRALERRSKDSGSFFIEEAKGQMMLSGNLAREFLTTQLAPLARDFLLFGTERLRKYRIVHSQPKLELKLGHGIDFLDGDGSLEIEGERVSILDALRQYRENKYIQLSDGNHAVIDAEYMDRLTRLFRKRAAGIRVSFFDLPIIEELIGESAAAATLPESRKVFRGFNELQERRLSLKGFTGTLRPYQKEGVKWLLYLNEHGLGGCLADDMGLGKTVQTVALISRIDKSPKHPVLIVMPRSLLFNWSRELERFLPGTGYHVHYGPGREWETALANPVILTTYGTLRSDIEAMAATEFAAVILDESQAIKNPQTQTARAALALKSRFRLGLSGTPVENHLGELYALFRFLNPAMFSSPADFERTYARPIQRDGDPEAVRDLRRKIYPFLLRRMKGDVLKDLPPKVEQVLYVEMGPEQKAHYESRRLFYKQLVSSEVKRNGIAKSQFIILEALLELRQIASVPESRTDGRIRSAKRERLHEALVEAIENGRKCLVFSNFLAGVEQVCEDFNEAGIHYERMTGSTSNREDRVSRFQNDPRVKAFVMTLKTGGLGLNLTAADTVFILDPWWNTSAESQAVDRAHRIGQANTVFTYRLIARDTIEEKILQLQERKKELVEQVVSTDAGAFKSLSEQDIDHLFND